MVLMVVIMVMLVLVVVVIAKLKLNLKMVVYCHMCQPARNIEPFFTLWRFNLKMHRQDCFLQCDWYGGDGQNAIWRKWWWWPLMITKWWCDKQGPSKTFEPPRCEFQVMCVGCAPSWAWSYCLLLSFYFSPAATNTKTALVFQTGSCIVYLSPNLPMMVASLGHKTGTKKSSALVCMVWIKPILAGPRFWNGLQLQPLPKGDITTWCFEMYSMYSIFHWIP